MSREEVVISIVPGKGAEWSCRLGKYTTHSVIALPGPGRGALMHKAKRLRASIVLKTMYMYLVIMI